MKSAKFLALSAAILVVLTAYRARQIENDDQSIPFDQTMANASEIGLDFNKSPNQLALKEEKPRNSERENRIREAEERGESQKVQQVSFEQSTYQRSYSTKRPLDYDQPKPIRPSQFRAHNRAAHQAPFVSDRQSPENLLRKKLISVVEESPDCDQVLQGTAHQSPNDDTQNPRDIASVTWQNQDGVDPLAPSILKLETPQELQLGNPNGQQIPIDIVPGRELAPPSLDSYLPQNPAITPGNQEIHIPANQPNVAGRALQQEIKIETQSVTPEGGVNLNDPLSVSDPNWSIKPLNTPTQKPAIFPVPDPNWTSQPELSPGFDNTGCDSPLSKQPTTSLDYFAKPDCRINDGSEFEKRPRRYIANESQFGQPYFSGENSALAIESGAFTFNQAMNYEVQYANQISAGFESASGPGARFDYFDLDAVAETVSGTVGGATTRVTGGPLTSTSVGDSVTADQRINITNVRADIFKRLYFPISTLSGGFGIDHLNANQETRFQLIPSGSTVASNQALFQRIFHGTGPTVAMDYYRPIGHSKFAFVGGFRGSLIFGRETLQTISDGILTNVTKNDRSVTTLEAYLGTEWGKMISTNRRLFLRGTVGGKSWQSLGVADNNDTDIGWLSFNLTAGLSY